jgi:hypothetical protein
MPALPGDEFLFVTVTLRIGDGRDPVEPRSISARLDRSNDGQDHTVLPYAAHPASPRGFAGLIAPFVRTQKDLTRFISPWSRLRVHDAATSTAPRPRRCRPLQLTITTPPSGRRPLLKSPEDQIRNRNKVSALLIYLAAHSMNVGIPEPFSYAD